MKSQNGNYPPPSVPTIFSRLLSRCTLSAAAYSAGAPPPLTLANWSSHVCTTASGAAEAMDSRDATAARRMAQSPCMEERWTAEARSRRHPGEDGEETPLDRGCLALWTGAAAEEEDEPPDEEDISVESKWIRQTISENYF